MNRIRITLPTKEMIGDFVAICSKYDCDINLYDGSVLFDAKSILSVFSIQKGKKIEVEIITSDESVISSFIKDMKKFEI